MDPFKIAYIAVAAVSFLLALLNAYQALTGKRVSKSPSRRSDQQMRMQSAIAAIGLGVLAVFGTLLILRMP